MRLRAHLLPWQRKTKSESQTFFQTHRRRPVDDPAEGSVITDPVLVSELPHLSRGEHRRVSYYRCHHLVEPRGDIQNQLRHLEMDYPFSPKLPEGLDDLIPGVPIRMPIIQLERALLSDITNQPLYYGLCQVFHVEQGESGIFSTQYGGDPLQHQAKQGAHRAVLWAINHRRAKRGPRESIGHCSEGKLPHPLAGGVGRYVRLT